MRENLPNSRITAKSETRIESNDEMNPYWINANGVRLGIVPRPRAWDWLYDDVNALRVAGVDVLLSALTLVEIDELGLASEADH